MLQEAVFEAIREATALGRFGVKPLEWAAGIGERAEGL